MRITLSFVIILCFGLQLKSQDKITDSLRRLLLIEKRDTARVKLLNKLAEYFSYSKPDSTLFYATQALELSQKSEYASGNILSLFYMSFAMALSGNISKALETCLEALKKSEQLHDDKLSADALSNIGTIYGIQGDLRQSILYESTAITIYKQIHDELNVSNNLMNVGHGFGQLNELDSARVYLSQSLEIALRAKNEDLISSNYLNLGIIYSKMRQYDLSADYYRLSLPYFNWSDNHLFLGSIYLGLAEVFDSTRQMDSSFYYGRLSFFHAKEMASPLLLLSTAQQLASLFKKNRKLDSAFIYEEIAMKAKDSLTNQEKQKQIQTLSFTEQLRQMEITEQKRKETESRKRNLQYAAIAIGLITFLILFLALSRSIIVKTKFIEFFAVLGLLAVFEFINLLIHPYLARVTNESPSAMLLILIIVGALLIPLHRKLEKWITSRMVEKNRKIRLEAAKKTIAKLEGEGAK